MTQTLARIGLLGAVALAVLGMTLLARPSEASAPPIAEQVAPAQSDLPDDQRGRPSTERRRPLPDALVPGTRVRVVRLGIDLPIEAGDESRDVIAQATPSQAAYLLPGSVAPGTLGNAYIYAHARPGLFLTLWQVRLGDRVEIVEPGGAVLGYVVSEVHPRVAPSDLRYITPSDDERLTLQTSTGPWVLSPRFVVIAKPLR